MLIEARKNVKEKSFQRTGELSGVHLRTNTKQTIGATLPVKMRLFFGSPFFGHKRKVTRGFVNFLPKN